MSSHRIVTKEGELSKYKNMWLGWGRRYFKLERSYLHYFEGKHSPQPVGTITRGEICEVKECQQFAGKSNVFELHTKSGLVWYLQAGSPLDELMSLRMFDLPFVQEEMHSWMCAIHAQGQFPPSSQCTSVEPSPSEATPSLSSEPMAPSLYGPGQGPYNGPLPHIYPNLYATDGPIYDPRVHGPGHSPPPSYEESAQAQPLPSKAVQ